MLTENQKDFLNVIEQNEPICDKCCSEKLNYRHNQNANGPCRVLRDEAYILRTKGKCNGCGRNVLLNSLVK